MPSGNADLKAKICAVPAKYCLVILCVLHVLVFLLVTGAVLYVYFSAPPFGFITDYFLFLLAPGALSLITGIGALMFLCVTKKLLMIICIAWPVLVFLACGAFYGISIYAMAAYGLGNQFGYSSYGYGTYIPTENVVAAMIGILILPLSCCCCCVLGCLGCCIKSPDGSGGSSNGNNGSRSKQGKFNKKNAGNTGPGGQGPQGPPGSNGPQGFQNQGPQGPQGPQQNYQNHQGPQQQGPQGLQNQGYQPQNNNNAPALHKNHSGHLWN